MTTRTYSGGCHCGAVRFRVRSEAITAGIRCNCSLCVRRGAVMSVGYLPRGDFEVLDGLETLSTYCWGDRTVNSYFCPTCGICPFHEVIARPGHYRLNLGCLEDLDPLALPIELIDGRSY